MIEPHVIKYSKQLTALGIENSLIEHAPSKMVDDVVKSIGITRSDSAATIVLKADNQFVAVIRRDDCKLDLKKIKKVLNTNNLRIATNEEFTAITGLEPGTATYYSAEIKKTLIDKKVCEIKYVVGGSGSFKCSIKHRTQDLNKIPGSQIADVTEIVLFTSRNNSGHKRVLSGIRATGRLHLGNYLGAVKGMIELQNKPDYETYYMVADLHTITTPYDVNELKINRREVIIDYLAAGLDPNKSVIFQQAEVKEHAELTFYLSSVVTIARMQHLPTFKDKVKQYPQHSTMALLNYPILMASDILLYKAGYVPVGIDQEPHLEVAREIASKMNDEYNMDFPEPVRFATKGGYIPSLKGEGKMSKSVAGSYINLTDSQEDINKKVRSIPTATNSGGVMNEGIKTLFTLAELFIPNNTDSYKKDFEKGTLQFVTIKDEIAAAIYNELRPIQEKRRVIEADKKYVDNVIKNGADRARTIASQTVREIKEKMGLA